MKRQLDLDADLRDVEAWLMGESHSAGGYMKEKLRALWWAYQEARDRSEALNAILVDGVAKAVQESFVLANPRPVLDTLTQEISAMKQHCVEARQALDINDFAHCAYEIDAALKVGAGTTATEGHNAGGNKPPRDGD